MTTHILRGTNEQIADQIANTPGRIVEAIVIVDEPLPAQLPLTDQEFDALVRDMDANSVSIGSADFSREVIYTRLEGE